DVGRLRGFDLLHRLGLVLVSWVGPGFSYNAGPGKRKGIPNRLRYTRLWMAWRKSTMAPLRDGVSSVGRYFDAAGLVGALDSFIRFRDIRVAGLAHDDLSSLLRRGRYLWGIRDGADVDAPCPIAPQAPGCIHLGPHRRDVQARPADRIDRRLRVLHGVFCRLLRSKSVRALRVFESLFWPLLVGFLDNVYL